MGTERKESTKARLTVKVEGTALLDPYFLDAGFAIAKAFTVKAEMQDPSAAVGLVWIDVAVEVADGRARARRISVESDRAGGVSSTALRKVPIRGIVAQGSMRALFRARTNEKGKVFATPLGSEDDLEAAVAVVDRLVGWVPKPEEVTR